MANQSGDLTVTAMYTSQAWKWGQFEAAELLSTVRARDVFNATNLALGAARMVRRDLPSLRHSLVQRHAILDWLLAESGCTQVLELAAGLSQRGAAVTGDARMRYIEVDLPGVIEIKRELLSRTERGRQILARDNLQLVAADVRDVDLAPLLVPERPVFVIAEGLLMYLDAAKQRALWTKLAALLADRPGSAVAFDLVPFCEQPKPGAIGRALGRMFKRATNGAEFAFDQRSRHDIARDLTSSGFAGVDIIEPHSAPRHWNLPALDRRTQVLVYVSRTGAPRERTQSDCR